MFKFVTSLLCVVFIVWYVVHKLSEAAASDEARRRELESIRCDTAIDCMAKGFEIGRRN
jgi:hypothetical protein